jgi:hypothetical protein
VNYFLFANCLTAEVLSYPVRFARFQQFGTSLALGCFPCKSFPLMLGERYRLRVKSPKFVTAFPGGRG